MKKSPYLDLKLIFLLAILTLIALSFLSYSRINSLISGSKWVNQSNLIKLSLENIYATLSEKESSMRAHMLAKDSFDLTSYFMANGNIHKELNKLELLIKDNPEQQQNARVLKMAVKQRTEMMDHNLALFNAANISIQDRLKGQELMTKVRTQIEKMEAEEDKLLTIRMKAFDRGAFITPLFTILLIIGSILILILSYFRIMWDLKISNTLRLSKEQGQYARSLIEASLDPLVTISAEGKILDVNEASIKVTGVPREKLIGTDFSNYFTEPQKAQRGYQQVFENGFVADYPLTVQHKDGNLTDVLYNASVYKDDKGNVLGVFAAARDVTKQKKSSQYARSLIEASLDPLVTISGEGKILDVNEASVKVTGVPREKLIGTDFSNYFTEPKKAQRGYQQVFENGFVADYPLTVQHKDGNLTDVLYNASVYKDDKGNVLGVFAAARDVTEQKRAIDLRIANKELAFQNEEKEKRAAELIVANKELAYQNEEKEKRAAELIAANKELEAFTYISSHDLQEPLRKIQTLVSIILEEESKNLSHSGNYNFQRIQSAAGKMQLLIEDLLAFSRINTTERKFEETDLHTIIEEIKAELKDTIQEKQATIEATNLYSAVIIAFQFRQLLYNLISNALKFSKTDIPSHIIIKSNIVTGKKLNNPNLSSEIDYCHISVQDNGIGFEPHFSERIFEVFQKLHGKEVYAGTGIGLAIVKKIVDNHNGLITATSEINKGATFDIYIPST